MCGFYNLREAARTILQKVTQRIDDPGWEISPNIFILSPEEAAIVTVIPPFGGGETGAGSGRSSFVYGDGGGQKNILGSSSTFARDAAPARETVSLQLTRYRRERDGTIVPTRNSYQSVFFNSSEIKQLISEVLNSIHGDVQAEKLAHRHASRWNEQRCPLCSGM